MQVILAFLVCFAVLTTSATANSNYLVAAIEQFQQAMSIANPELAQLIQSQIDKLLPLLNKPSRSFEIELARAGVLDTVFSFFGVGNLLPVLSGLPSTLSESFKLLVEKVFFAGTNAWTVAKPILFKLLVDLKDHAADAYPLVQAAMADLTTQALLPAIAGKRALERAGLLDTVFSFLGISNLLPVLQLLPINLNQTFTLLVEKIFFAGTNAWTLAQPILWKLVADLKDHAADAVPLVLAAVEELKNQVLPQLASGKRDIQYTRGWFESNRGFFESVMTFFGVQELTQLLINLKSNLNTQFFQMVEKVFFAGQKAWADSSVVLKQLLVDLKAHASDATPLLSNAITQLQQVLAEAVSGKRDLELERNVFDLLNLGALPSFLAETHGNLKVQFWAVVEKLKFAGAAAWAQASVILAQLLKDLLAHAGNTDVLFQTALAQLQQVVLAAVAQGVASRDAAVARASVLDFFGLSAVNAAVSSIGQDLQTKFYAVLNQLLFAGTQAWAQAKDIFAQLVKDLLAHGENASPLIQAALAQLQQVVVSSVAGNQRGLADTLGLTSVWGLVQNLAGSTKEKFLAVLTQLLFAGQNALNAAKPIISQLVSDLLAHGENAGPIVTSALAELQQVVANTVSQNGKREIDIERGLADTLGLTAVWSVITGAAGNVKESFLKVVAQLLFAGTTAWNNAKPIFAQLLVDLTAHAENAGPLLGNAVAALQQVVAGSVAGKREAELALERGFADLFGAAWAVIKEFHGQAKDKFMAVVTQVLFAGTNAWAQAKPIFSQLVSDLLAHAENAGPLLATAASSLQQVVADSVAGKRELRGPFDFLQGPLAALQQFANETHGNLKVQFFTLLEQVKAAGVAAWAQATVILAQLLKDLLAHAGNSDVLFQAAVAQLQQVVLGAVAQGVTRDAAGVRAGVLDFFGLSAVNAAVSSIGQDLQTKFYAVLNQLLFAGTQAWAQAKDIFAQLVKDLLAHGENASPLIQAALAQLQQVVVSSVAGNQRGPFDFLNGPLAALNQFVAEAHGNVVEQFWTAVEQVKVAGLAAWGQATVILAQLLKDLITHAGNTDVLFQNAAAQLTEVAQGAAVNAVGKRGLVEDILAGQFNAVTLGQLVSLAGPVKVQLLALVEKVKLSNGAILAQGQQVVAQLLADLKANKNPLVAVSTAINALKALLQ